jgi:hypothetical protein
LLPPPTIAVTTGVFTATAAGRGGCLAAVAAAALVAALPLRAQRMSGQRWVHCLVFGWLVCCEPHPLSRQPEIESRIDYAFVIHKHKISFGTANLCVTNTNHK